MSNRKPRLWPNTALRLLFSSLSSNKLTLSHLPQTLIPEASNSYFSNPFIFKRQLPYSQPASFPLLICSTFTAPQHHLAVGAFIPMCWDGIQPNVCCQLPSTSTMSVQSQALYAYTMTNENAENFQFFGDYHLTTIPFFSSATIFT